MTWRPDGWDATVRIGVLTPHADVGPESEFNAMAPSGIAIHAARVPFGAMTAGGAMDPTIPLAPVRAFAEPPHVDAAAQALAAAPLHAIGYAFTSSAYVLGADGERAMIERLEQVTRGIPVVAASTSMAAALRALGVGSAAVFDPPWFDQHLSDLGRRYFTSAGIQVVQSGPCGLPSDQARIEPADLHAWIVEHLPDGAQAIVVGGNGFRAVGVIDALETQLGLPVVTANQALFWAALRAAGASTDSVTGYGRLFGTTT
jgi:maleate isomerase